MARAIIYYPSSAQSSSSSSARPPFISYLSPSSMQHVCLHLSLTLSLSLLFMLLFLCVCIIIYHKSLSLSWSLATIIINQNHCVSSCLHRHFTPIIQQYIYENKTGTALLSLFCEGEGQDDLHFPSLPLVTWQEEERRVKQNSASFCLLMHST